MASKNGQTLNTAWNRRLFVDLNREDLLFFYRENDDRCFSCRQRVNGQLQSLVHSILDVRVWRARERAKRNFLNIRERFVSPCRSSMTARFLCGTLFRRGVQPVKRATDAESRVDQSPPRVERSKWTDGPFCQRRWRTRIVFFSIHWILSRQGIGLGRFGWTKRMNASSDRRGEISSLFVKRWESSSVQRQDLKIGGVTNWTLAERSVKRRERRSSTSMNVLEKNNRPVHWRGIELILLDTDDEQTVQLPRILERPIRSTRFAWTFLWTIEFIQWEDDGGISSAFIHQLRERKKDPFPRRNRQSDFQVHGKWIRFLLPRMILSSLNAWRSMVHWGKCSVVFVLQPKRGLLLNDGGEQQGERVKVRWDIPIACHERGISHKARQWTNNTDDEKSLMRDVRRSSSTTEESLRSAGIDSFVQTPSSPVYSFSSTSDWRWRNFRLLFFALIETSLRSRSLCLSLERSLHCWTARTQRRAQLFII